MGKVWAAQERLWIQRTLLEVIADVNKNAKDWDTAIIKQINKLEVGNATAQDQMSIAKGEALEEAPAITDPKPRPRRHRRAHRQGGQIAAGGPDAMMTGMPGGARTNARLGLLHQVPDQESPVQDPPVPVVGPRSSRTTSRTCSSRLENSPMAIQVIDFEMAKPSTRVVKPVKGETMNFAGYDGAGNMTSMMATFNACRAAAPACLASAGTSRCA